MLRFFRKPPDSQYRDGFDWAAGAILRNEYTPQAIQDKVYGSHDPFDKGCLAAIRTLQEYKNASLHALP